MEMKASEIRALTEQVLTEIKGWPSCRAFYEFWKPIYQKTGNISFVGESGLCAVPPELKRCLLTLGESNINKCIFLHEPRKKPELEQELIFGYLFDGRLLAFNPTSETPECIYLLSDTPGEPLLVAESMVPLLAWVINGLKTDVRRGMFS